MLNLFSTPVKIVEVKDKELLKKHISTCSHLGFKENIWDNADETVKEFIQNFIQSEVKKYLKELTQKDIEVTINKSWITLHKKNHWHSPHHHSSNHVSCVYYLQSDEKSGDLLLLDPRGGVQFLNVSDKNNLGQEVNSRSYWKYTPKTGDLIIFPSYLVHCVSPNTTDEERRSVAFNLKYNFNQLL